MTLKKKYAANHRFTLFTHAVAKTLYFFGESCYEAVFDFDFNCFQMLVVLCDVLRVFSIVFL